MGSFPPRFWVPSEEQVGKEEGGAKEEAACALYRRYYYFKQGRMGDDNDQENTGVPSGAEGSKG